MAMGIYFSTSSSRLISSAVLFLCFLFISRASALNNGPAVSLEKYPFGRIYDISRPIKINLTIWADHLLSGNFIVNSTMFKLQTHIATHVDAPGHVDQTMMDKGFDADHFDLRILNGLALVVDVPTTGNITGEDLKILNIPRGVKRLLLRTQNTVRGLMHTNFTLNFTGFTADGAQWLVKNTDVKLLGVDYLSCAAVEEAAEVHRILLVNAGIVPVESLNLDDIRPGMYMLHCLPLRLPGADGSPARCILVK